MSSNQKKKSVTLKLEVEGDATPEEIKTSIKQSLRVQNLKELEILDSNTSEDEDDDRQLLMEKR